MIGASGQVGHCILEELHKRGLDALGTYNTRSLPGLWHLHLEDDRAISSLVLGLKPKCIYLCAALTHVDYCEEHRAESFRANVIGVAHLAHLARKLESRLVYISTDYVFDGKAGPYVETDKPAPVNVFGEHKLASEYIVSQLPNIIARTTWVYSHEQPGPGKNFVERLIASLAKGEEVRVPTDQFGTPTYAPDLAERLVTLAQAGETGLVHLAGTDWLSKYEFAMEVAGAFGLDYGCIRGLPTSALGQVAPRPLRAGLKTMHPYILPDLGSSLRRMVEVSQ